MEVPSPVAGILKEILAQEGQTVPMGEVIAEIEVEGGDEAVAGMKPPTSVAAPTEEALDTTGMLLKDVAPVGPTGSGGPAPEPPAPEVKGDGAGRAAGRHSPAVQRLAAEHGVDLSEVTGTGIGGRVTRKDVQAYIESAPVSTPAEKPTVSPGLDGPDEERVPLTTVRRMIAENMVRSATQIPHAWSMMEADVTGLVQLRESIKADFQAREGANLTYLPFVVSAAAEALKEHPLLNSTWDGDAIVLKRRIHIGVAVAGAHGLVVPVVKDADSLSVAGLAKAINTLRGKARDGKLLLEDVQGGTFTLDNTGALGSVISGPLINHPQAAIMTTDAIVKRAVVMSNDTIAIRSVMNLCLSFDHRIMDGAEAGAFQASVKRRLEAIGTETGIY